MNKEELYNLAFQLILHSGNAKSFAMEAMQKAKEGNFDEAEEKLTEADSAFNEAHHVQTDLIQKEAGGEKVDFPLIMVHAQDHLMNSMTLKDMAREIIELHKLIKKA
ncbi:MULTISPECIES: PTS lactose/cellobiose transporter subunit IIA [unclassified Bacillus (in: firmicutes)]|uniref:PTS lactose/cellobiose transporter subunit IIA n=1 Tax=unclassified Bacillus (in: firmicutes) TaxID=185979 RepID=UPI000BEFC70A|nr:MULTISPECIES: PTS lactose/cellobiose transporter subunit IIA [unclassified Bacillus (in: firmicutes)]PEJ56695.1 PTS cellobiose transporter subunit IIA [Bacillus sp. AFS002410]PEL04376.1 PTS cellobiose transporter subunit IIA [Bacillus sp. AFS017336]